MYSMIFAFIVGCIMIGIPAHFENKTKMKAVQLSFCAGWEELVEIDNRNPLTRELEKRYTCKRLPSFKSIDGKLVPETFQ